MNIDKTSIKIKKIRKNQIDSLKEIIFHENYLQNIYLSAEYLSLVSNIAIFLFIFSYFILI
jgi:hypothetical protein